jgi:hypothetical protein
VRISQTFAECGPLLFILAAFFAYVALAIETSRAVTRNGLLFGQFGATRSTRFWVWLYPCPAVLYLAPAPSLSSAAHDPVRPRWRWAARGVGTARVPCNSASVKGQLAAAEARSSRRCVI